MSVPAVLQKYAIVLVDFICNGIFYAVASINFFRDNIIDIYQPTFLRIIARCSVTIGKINIHCRRVHCFYIRILSNFNIDVYTCFPFFKRHGLIQILKAFCRLIHPIITVTTLVNNDLDRRFSTIVVTTTYDS